MTKAESTGNDKSNKRPVSSQGASNGKVKSPGNKPRSQNGDGQNRTPSGTPGSKKPKKKQHKKKKKKTKAVEKVDKTRDFSGDLEEYLQEWEDRNNEGAQWKFNKILQAWALDNCFSKKNIGSLLFKKLIPYVLTVQGGAMDRLVSRAAAIMSTDKSDIIDDDEGLVTPTVDADAEDTAEAEVDAAESDEEGVKKKKAVITKSMVSRAKKLQKALNA